MRYVIVVNAHAGRGKARRLRDEIAFPDQASLVKQLRADAQKVRDMLRW